jgi:SAM-dependent methyltransferase
MKTSPDISLRQFIRSDAQVDWSDPTLPRSPIQKETVGLRANADYFGHPVWSRNYLAGCHRSGNFRSRWHKATGSWDDKIVVDVGCGPGNVYAAVGGEPKLLIGVDVSEGGLRIASELGYTPLLADAHAMPLVSGFADIVALNATLHHCDDMQRVLLESARLVKPGGILVIDHDPQLSSIDFHGLAKGLWHFRLKINRLLRKGFHASREEQELVLKTEIHHDPGEGLAAQLLLDNLKPLGFEVELYPHNDGGAEVIEGNYGEVPQRFRVIQRLSGINPDSPEAAIILMSVARLKE